MTALLVIVALYLFSRRSSAAQPALGAPGGTGADIPPWVNDGSLVGPGLQHPSDISLQGMRTSMPPTPAPPDPSVSMSLVGDANISGFNSNDVSVGLALAMGGDVIAPVAVAALSGKPSYNPTSAAPAPPTPTLDQAPPPTNLTPAAQRQLAAQGGNLLPGQYIDPNWGFLYSPITAAERAGSLDPTQSYNMILGVKTPLYQN